MLFLKKLKEPNNLKGKNSYRFNGLVHDKTVGVTAAADKKGVVLTTRNQSGYIFNNIQYSRLYYVNKFLFKWLRSQQAKQKFNPCCT